MPAPLDRGWAWCVALAVMFNNTIMVGLVNISGIIFIEMESSFQASSSLVAFIIGFRAAVFSIFAVVGLGIFNEFLHSRFIIITGGICACIGFVSAFGATCIEHMFAYAILAGAGHSLIYGPGLVMVGKYFDKRRSLGNGIAVSGTSLGTLIFPYLMLFLIEEFGFLGAMLVCGGICLNCCVAGLLLRPTEFYNRGVEMMDSDDRFSDDNDLENDANNADIADGVLDIREINNVNLDGEKFNDERLHDNRDIIHDGNNFGRPTEDATEMSLDKVPRNDGKDGINGRKNSADICDKNPYNENLEDDKMSANNLDNLDVNKHVNKSAAENLDDKLCEAPPVNRESRKYKTHDKNELQTTTQRYHFMFSARKGQRKKRLTNMTLMKQPLFITFQIASSIYMVTLTIQVLFLPALAKDDGRSLPEITILLSLLGVTDFIGRLFFGFLGDTGWIDRKKIFIITSTIIGVLSCLTTFMTGFWWLLVYHCVYGLFSSAYATLMPVALVDLFGIDNMSRSLSTTLLLKGVLQIGLSPALGYIKDRTGSFVGSFALIGGLLLTGSAMFLFVILPLVRRRERIVAISEGGDGDRGTDCGQVTGVKMDSKIV